MLRVDRELCINAAKWAKELGRTGEFKHEKGIKSGENLFGGWGGKDPQGPVELFDLGKP